ncbi:MAG: outer membrane beta-barrel protein [Bacteroidia bacterium]|nr:outer membrane beta-barrel protein [Bacteroidia bacterium]
MLSNKIIKCCLLILFIIQQSDVFAQSRFFLSAGAGISYYNGDLRDKKLLPPAKFFHLMGDFNVGYNIDKHLDLTLNYYKGKVNCADSLANEKDNLLRNQNFRSKIDEVNLMLRFKLFRIDKRNILNPYVMAGFGWLFFNPEGYYNGQWYSLQPLGTEGQYVFNSKEDYPKPYKLTTNSLPVGFGVWIRINDFLKVKAEFVQHFSFTDYLDDTSGKYPDSLELAATPNGYYATIFSSRRLDGFPSYRRSRGNATANDNYVSISAGIVFNPKRQKSYEYRRLKVFSRFFEGKKGGWGNRGKGIE